MKNNARALRELEDLEKMADSYNPLQVSADAARQKLKTTLYQLADDLVEMFGQSQKLNTSSTDDEIYNPSMLSMKIGVPRNTLTQWRITGEGPKFFKVGKSVYYRGKEVREWAASLPKYQKTSEHLANLL